MFLILKQLANEVVSLPKEGRRESKTKPPSKVPSFHLTGAESMKNIKSADERAKEKKKEEEKKENIKKEALKDARKKERNLRKNRK